VTRLRATDTYRNPQIVNGKVVIRYRLESEYPGIITADSPAWVFVKLQRYPFPEAIFDTDDDDISSDSWLQPFKPENMSRNNYSITANKTTVNQNLSGDVGLVESVGEKKIFWDYKKSNIKDEPSAMAYLPHVYVIQMVKVPVGKNNHKSFEIRPWRSENMEPRNMKNDFYISKYHITFEQYSNFVNATYFSQLLELAKTPSNQLQSGAVRNYFRDMAYLDFLFYPFEKLTGYQWLTSHGSPAYNYLEKSGAIDALPGYTSVSSNNKNRAASYPSWYNAQTFASWAGLRLPSYKEYFYEISNKGKNNDRGVLRQIKSEKDKSVYYNYFESLPLFTSDVTLRDGIPSHKAGKVNNSSIHGMIDPIGNAYVWTSTAYQGEKKGTRPVDNFYAKEKVIAAGGGYGDKSISIFTREANFKEYRCTNTSFRVALSGDE
jgi:formylglycine-generating enzyme required for sulfatase activity